MCPSGETVAIPSYQCLTPEEMQGDHTFKVNVWDYNIGYDLKWFFHRKKVVLNKFVWFID